MLKVHKKIWPFLVPILFFLPTIGNALIQFSIPHLEIPLEGTIIAPVELVSNEPEGFYSWEITIAYDPSILSFVEMLKDKQLTQNYTWLFAYADDPPGKIKVLGTVGYDKTTGKDIPTVGTGILFSLKFGTKRAYPRWSVSSDIIMSFKDSPGNSLRFAICDHGSIKIKPNLGISYVQPSNGLCCEDVPLSIYGVGFTAGAIPVIGSVQGSNTIVDSNLITTLIPVNSLSPGSCFDVIVTNPNGDFGVIEDGYEIYACEIECNGDINGSGGITPRDVLCAFEKYLNKSPASCDMEPDAICCDVNKDNHCTPVDALCIFKEYLGFPSCLNGYQD